MDKNIKLIKKVKHSKDRMRTIIYVCDSNYNLIKAYIHTMVYNKEFCSKHLETYINGSDGKEIIYIMDKQTVRWFE